MELKKFVHAEGQTLDSQGCWTVALVMNPFYFTLICGTFNIFFASANDILNVSSDVLDASTKWCPLQDNYSFRNWMTHHISRSKINRDNVGCLVDVVVDLGTTGMRPVVHMFEALIASDPVPPFG